MTSAAASVVVDAAPWWRAPENARFLIEGGAPLVGEIAIGGAKNAALPLLVCALLTDDELVLRNLPRILDVAMLSTVLRDLGLAVEWEEGGSLTGRFRGLGLGAGTVNADLVARMRASFLIAGALVARLGRVSLPLPGGDAIGSRPVDFHLAGLRAMGAKVDVSGGTVTIEADSGLHGATIVLPMPSVGATEHLMIAAALADGETRIVNAAHEPEIVDLAALLNAMGARIEGAGQDTVVIQGVPRLHGADHAVMPDRIELGTYVAAAAMTGGRLLMPGVTTAMLGAAAPVMRAAGVDLVDLDDGLLAGRSPRGLRGTDVVTQPFPGFATDLQPQMVALLGMADGAAMVTETLFENRFQHVRELVRMGAQMTVMGNLARIRGIRRYTAAAVEATDIRAGSALVLAALAGEGTTEIAGVMHLDRGYEDLERKLIRCGARIRRVAA
ncbi:MAG TPA: UDP-N-acetylglucosamine 1-carboxyvinyltransferase [Alphaproteobacteria bacterium]|nr:UDP-N-acetylglucosamine 1-carboxyvinyltransferase [Alphaproteobacteria bacterium]